MLYGVNLHNDVVDGYMNELDEEPDEAHDGEADCSGQRDFLELFSVRLRAPLHQPDRVLGELLGRHHECCNLIHFLSETFQRQSLAYIRVLRLWSVQLMCKWIARDWKVRGLRMNTSLSLSN